MAPRTLDQWLAWQERLHPRTIDLGLERVSRVARALGLVPAPFPVVSVAGTNGKGSTVAYLEAFLGAAGVRVGAYTSPHLLRYNERVRVRGREVSDEALVSAFEAVDGARAGISLSYFEFGTLAALHLFREERVEVAVLEVGLGGRLDAVNVWDADVALITAIGLDHMEWLGPDRESIGREKAGILRAGRPAVLTDPQPPRSVLQEAARLGVPLRRIGQAFQVIKGPAGRWTLASKECRWPDLPAPGIPGDPQYANVAGAIEALRALGLPPEREAVAAALPAVRLPGRFQRIPGRPELVLDVAHNAQACAALAATLQASPVAGPTVALMAVMADKDPAAMAAQLHGVVDAWVVATAPGARGLEARPLAAAVAAAVSPAALDCVPELGAALDRARQRAGPEGRVVVFGSFYTVAEILRRCTADVA